MTDMSLAQIEREFRRQVRLCSGLGAGKMREIVAAVFEREGNRFCNQCGGTGRVRTEHKNKRAPCPACMGRTPVDTGRRR